MCLNFFHRSATSEPIISEPFLAGSIKVEESFYFLAIFTRGFYEALEEISGSKQVRDFFFPYHNSIEMRERRIARVGFKLTTESLPELHDIPFFHHSV